MYSCQIFIEKKERDKQDKREREEEGGRGREKGREREGGRGKERVGGLEPRGIYLYFSSYR